MRSIVAGDREAFRLLMEKYRNYMYKVVYSVLGHPKDAEDVTQEALVKLYVSLPQYKFEGFKTWMTRIAVNKAIDYKRAREHRVELVFDQPEEAMEMMESTEINSPEARYMREYSREQIRHRIREMPPNYRDVVHAFYIEDKSYQEIAAEFGVAVKTVEVKLYRAKQWIRKTWKEEEFK
nr:sigma-70 family RNA polymerase sigma factor [Paenibacillus thalictri]